MNEIKDLTNIKTDGLRKMVNGITMKIRKS